jgi:hypothetical protein
MARQCTADEQTPADVASNVTCLQHAEGSLAKIAQLHNLVAIRIDVPAQFVLRDL